MDNNKKTIVIKASTIIKVLFIIILIILIGFVFNALWFSKDENESPSNNLMLGMTWEILSQEEREKACNEFNTVGGDRTYQEFKKGYIQSAQDERILDELPSKNDFKTFFSKKC